MPDLNDLMPTTPDLNRERLEQLKRLMPDLFNADGRLDPEELKRVVDPGSVPESERFEFRWFGKADAKRRAFTPTTAALQYDDTRSVNPEVADGNMIIEGENLEALKCLLAAYREKIKCIYIDPPYNTGNDFVYSDNYSEQRKAYWEQTGVTEEGIKVDTNSESDGRYHSNWLNMMYPRLLAARQLLREDGIILISIDDHEYQNLKHLMDETFGKVNYIATLIWEKGRKNDAKLFSVGHEYLVVYAKSKYCLKEEKAVWREEKPGAKEIWGKYLELKQQHGDNFDEIENGLTLWFKKLPKKHPSKKLSRYRRVDKFGPWRDRDISWPGGGGPRYDVPHPVTKKPCKVPEAGWRFSNPEEMKRKIELGFVEFRDDHSEPPFMKAHIRPIPEELPNGLNGDEVFSQEDPDEEFATQVRGSYFYKQSQVSVKLFRELMGEKIFENPKDHDEIAKLLNYVSSSDKEAITLDFFAGSGTTGHAVMDLNKEDGGNRKFILVQLPEQTDEKSGAFKAGYKKISDITIERNKQVIARIEQEQTEKQQQGLFEQGQETYKPGFKVYRLVKSHFPRVEFQPDPEKTAEENIALLRQYIADKEATLYSLFNEADIFDEVMLKNGFQLNYTREPVADFDENQVYRVADGHKTALVCLDAELKDATVATLSGRDEIFICLERAVDTTKKWNLKHMLGEKLVAF